MMTGAQILIECLKAQGVDCIVGMPGNQNIHLYDALLQADGIDHFLIRNEQGATLMANGYARASGRVGVAFTVPGPGATNASTGIVDAHTDCVPVLLITGGTEVAFNGRARSKCFHGLDQSAFFGPITKFFARPESLQEIPDVVTAAFKALRALRPGPAVLELPTDIAAQSGEVEIPSRVEHQTAATAGNLALAVEALLRMSRPVILAGGNVLEANASEDLIGLAEMMGAPVVLTRLGKSAFPDSHPLSAGHCRGKLGRTVLTRADGVLAIGCRFTQIDTSGWTTPLPSIRVQLDPEADEVGREYEVDAGITGHLKNTIPDLTEALSKQAAGFVWGNVLHNTRLEIQNDRPPLPVLSAMRDVLQEDAIISVDVTSIGYRSFDEFPVDRPRTFMYPCHSVTLGFALPAALGAKLSCPETQVAAFCGDGGFQMTAYELATAAEHGIGVVCVVINDGSLSAIRGSQAKTFEGRTIDTDMQTPRLADLARAMGARGIRVDDPDRFPAVFSDMIGLEGPSVIEVMMQDQRDHLISRVPWLYPD